MRIALDLDGILWDIMVEWLRIYNERFPDQPRTRDEISCWDFFEKWEFPPEDVVYDIFHEIDIMDVPIIEEGVSKHLEELNEKHAINILTTRRPETRDDVIKKLESMGIYKGTHYGSMIITPYKPFDVKASFSYDIFIDDSAELARTIARHRDKIQLMLDQPWNRKTNYDMHLNILRVYNWKEIMDCFKVYNKVYNNNY